MSITITAQQKQEVFEPMFKYFETEEILEYFKEVVTKIPNAIFYKPASSSSYFSFLISSLFLHLVNTYTIYHYYLPKPYMGVCLKVLVFSSCFFVDWILGIIIISLLIK